MAAFAVTPEGFSRQPRLGLRKRNDFDPGARKKKIQIARSD
jgi:hypothetical protein